jgi:hypothetical protein
MAWRFGVLGFRWKVRVEKTAFSKKGRKKVEKKVFEAGQEKAPTA